MITANNVAGHTVLLLAINDGALIFASNLQLQDGAGYCYLSWVSPMHQDCQASIACKGDHLNERLFCLLPLHVMTTDLPGGL